MLQEWDGWPIAWITRVIVGIFSTFGPAPGSIERIIYTTFPVTRPLGGQVEVLTQSLLLSFILFSWVDHPQKRWLSWTLGTLFVVPRPWSSHPPPTVANRV